MTDIRRLKFAWARGARIQNNVCCHPDTWWRHVTNPAWHGTFRIYPDDERFEYGPLSTAMLEIAVSETLIVGSEETTPLQWAANELAEAEAYSFFDPEGFRRHDGSPEVLRFFKLFLAEYLADEGL